MLGIGGIVEAVGKVASDLITTDKERFGAEISLTQIDAGVAQAQIAVNAEEAKSTILFVAGARPAIMWIGAAALAWTFIAHPMLTWIWSILQACGWISPGTPSPPTLDTDDLWVIISGILGLGGFRSYEKAKGVARK